MSENNASTVRTLVFKSLSDESSPDLMKNADARSRRQAREYINGITRQKRWLDHIIDASYSGSRKLDSCVRIVLQIGCYDLLFLSTPHYAAINDAVNLARTECGPKVTGLVNAVLRRLQRDGPPAPQTGSGVSDLGVRYSHPDWMVSRWIDQFGRKQTEDLLAYNNDRPRHCIRVNSAKVKTDDVKAAVESLGVEIEPGQYLEGYFYCTVLQDLLSSSYFKDGWFTVQDESAGLVVDIADPQRGQTIIDLCSSPGGKTGYMLERVRGDCRMIAVDKSQARLDLVQSSVQRIGFPDVDYFTMDATLPDQVLTLPEADLLLIDAPCSGLGVLSKRADMRWKRSERQIRDLVQLQDSLLDAAALRVRQNGILVYSTCTIEPTENQDRVAAFLERNRDFVLDPVSLPRQAAKLVEDGMFRSLPHLHGIDGAFAARMRKTSV
ncbi:MAG: 16S rRNA (cytosine(967)-C(5))-methyltransferase RsmB [Rhodothermales bacterium]|nr:16S rRNA (cytosine(967)-C(5))-methyltransferase RsmB [Rhodothermales bacterium]